MKKITVFIVVVTTVLLTFSTCKKSKENNVIGKWQIVSFSTHPSNEELLSILEFDEEYNLKGIKMEGGKETASYHANWKVDRQGLRCVLVIDSEKTFRVLNSSDDLRGVYRFLQESRDVLRIVRIEAYKKGEWKKGGEVYMLLDLLKR